MFPPRVKFPSGEPISKPECCRPPLYHGIPEFFYKHFTSWNMSHNSTALCSSTSLPLRAGVGLKAQHYRQILDQQPDIGWFEIHPENYMGNGGPPHKYLSKIRELYPLSVHGVGLSIGGTDELDKQHLKRLKTILDRYQPESFSEHLAWSTHQGRYFNDLLAAPYTNETLQTVCHHIDEIQNSLGRTMLLENPATYIAFEDSTIDEIDFLGSIAKTTGCGLLLDVNNVFVSCTNHNKDARKYIERFPHQYVAEIHLAGHSTDLDDIGEKLLIDAHDRAVCKEVWELFDLTLEKGKAVAALIEWDNDIPDWDVLFGEAQKAERHMAPYVSAPTNSGSQTKGEPLHGLV
jgi:uncharacterized protein (UPF0276 family)